MNQSVRVAGRWEDAGVAGRGDSTVAVWQGGRLIAVDHERLEAEAR